MTMRHIPQLDGLRAMAVFAVFAHHAFHVPLLWCGVDLFFILSGYLITGILMRDVQRHNLGTLLGKFYLRRAERILPAYALCLVALVFTQAVDWRRLWPYYGFFLQNVPYAFHWIPSGPLVPLWSLAVEQHFYLVWPFLVYFCSRRQLLRFLIGILVVVPILRIVCTPLFPTSDAIYCLTPFRIDAMAAGGLLAVILPHCDREKVLRSAQICLAVGLMIYAVLALQPWFRRPLNNAGFNGIDYSLNILVLGSLFVWAILARSEGLLVRTLSNPVLRFFGRISYMFYLSHLFFLQIVTRVVPSHLAATMTGFAVTTAFATLSWYLYEKPILNLSRHHKKVELPTIT